LREAQPGEFTRRAFENGRIDLTEAEGLADLLEAETEMQRKAALALAEGGLTRQIARWQEQLLALSAQAERAIDYDEENEIGIDPALLRDCGSLVAELREWLARPRTDVLKDGVRVVVAGPVNAGKSSLINAIAGTERAIVTDVPGTTRDHIEVPLSLGGIPVLLTDTAGLRDTEDQVEAIGIARAEKLVTAADILVWLGEAAEAPEHRRLVLVHPRSDQAGRGAAPERALPVSSKTGTGLSALLDLIVCHSKEIVPGASALSLNRRQAENVAQAAEAISAATTAFDIVVLAEGLRSARAAFDRLTGRAGFEDVLDALFGRFCLGK
jgi:tRNA modification GTPase